MRVFVIKSDTSCIENINPKSPASSGRLDVVLDFMIEALSSARSRDIVVYSVLSGCRESTIEIRDNVPLSETELVMMIMSEKVRIMKIGFRELILKLIREGYQLIYLHEKGAPINTMRITDNSAFIVGDQDGLSSDDEEFLRRVGAKWVSLGTHSYMAWQCAVIINYLTDRMSRT